MKTAVILSARKERDSQIPYPLKPCNGNECLIDRTLSILEELAYDKIYIVAGFKAELFEKYLSDKVKVIINPNYAFTSSMASLASLENEINEDFLLIEGDTFYEKKVIEQLTDTKYSNCMAVTEESGSGDEAFVESCNGFITKINKDHHQIFNYAGELLGIIRISLCAYRKMLDLWHQSSNSYLNYEYVFFEVTKSVQRPYIYFKNLIWGDVDTKEDFHKLKNSIFIRLKRKENPFDYDNLLNHLQKIFPNRNVLDAKIEQIGGMSNKNFKVKLQNDLYVLRVPGNGSDGMVDRVCEDENSNKMQDLGLNTNILYFDDETGIKLVDFIKGADTLNSATIQREDNLIKIASILRTLHRSNIRFNNDFNVFREILNYEKLLLLAGGGMYEGYNEVRFKIFALDKVLNSYGVVLSPCHNDLVAENFVKSESGKIYLIDWEYSGMNDPLWDVAGLFIESEFSQDNEDFFLHKYYKGNIPKKTSEKIVIYQILMDILWAIWARIKEAKGDDFGSYGIDRYNRAIKNLNKYNF